ncbi:N-formylglutamate amidohydrolase [Phaeobacter inhibens]|uniref:N-formylglutamate amidohydrolase n=1 Tax=Phaeobacter inhibens TaxID=221822 RepID=UPI0021A5F4C4|nr:N-formylglutamate amidohydrolase [Phaeobacter inhibens]UWR55770.1 N-formylglutamate amidohydrolase [Phaeobacter inhibens]UWR98975.1 N-formylglutamate amidohydrolase [Phaeobacter inhibens]UWS02863.1 N-formylglutamate amidohydrolase [Phaeobacter inhibens]
MMPQPLQIINPDGAGPVVIICEHASAYIPAIYDDLGLAHDDLKSHAAWDPGALDLSLKLSADLDAPVVASTVSRLVYDCNRPPEATSAMPESSELIDVPGNRDLTPADRQARATAVYDPFCAAVSQILDARGSNTVLVTVHSFTPVYFGQPREVEIGLLHDDDSRLVDAMLEHIGRLPGRKVARNEPYGPGDGVTHTLRLHAQPRGLPNVMIEVRNDLMRSEHDIAERAREILLLLEPAVMDMNSMERTS